MSAVLQTQTRTAGATPALDMAGASLEPGRLREQFELARRGGQRARDIALSLGLSEGQAIAAHAGSHEHGLKAMPLKGPWVDLLQALELCGPLMALTCNESVVHEKTGVYQNISATGHMGLALGEEIDLRLFLGRWHAGFAVLEPAGDPKNPPLRSLQFFDRHGVAVHKVFTRPQTDIETFQDIADQFSDEAVGYEFTPAPPKPAPKPDAELDSAGLLQGWREMTDTHQFFGLISRFGVERQQAFRLVEGQFTECADTGIVRSLLDAAAASGASIMVFVSSSGCIQIHSGPIRRVQPLATPTARWLNVLDAGFNLHLREDRIAHAWIVKKPTADGVVTSVEIFDAAGELMAMFFGSRKPGIPEQQAWRDIAAGLPRLQAQA
ncbi:MAG: hemin-degrading factor [Polaromonas sp.]|nr:hemin-degrading factor [Polaromonas sp.]